MRSYTQSYSYNDFNQGILGKIPDSLNIISGITNSRYKAFHSNPNLYDIESTAVILAIADEVVVGRLTIYPTSMMIDGKIEIVMGGSDLYVDESYRQEAAGTDLMIYPVFDKYYRYILYAGASPQALPIYKKLKYQIIEYPRMMQLRNSRCILESKGLHGAFLKIASSITNIPLKAILAFNNLTTRIMSKKYVIEKVSRVPAWVDDILKNDRHKYKEVHDQKWLQWNLDYHFTDAPENIQSFYIVKKDNEELGYFMTKERYRNLAGGVLKDVIIGSIVEWGSFDETILTEKDIYILAMSTFSNKLDILEFASNDSEVTKAMKKFFFLKHGFAHILFMDKQRKHTDASDINNWRVRYGYADVILS